MAQLIDKRYNSEYIFSHYLDMFIEADEKDLIDFLISQIFRNDFTAVKKMNHFQKKIFAYEKGNKYHNDIKLATMCLKKLQPLIN